MHKSKASSATDSNPPADSMPGERLDDRSSIEAWVRTHQVGAWRYVRMRGAPPDLADDLVQEALMAAIRKHIHAEPHQRAAAWLRSALDNLWHMHLRTEGRRSHHVEAALAARALLHAGQDDGSEYLAALRACLAGVDGRSRRLLQLHYAIGASRQAIADELGMRANGIKALLRRVRGALRQCVLRRLSNQERGER